MVASLAMSHLVHRFTDGRTAACHRRGAWMIKRSTPLLAIATLVSVHCTRGTPSPAPTQAKEITKQRSAPEAPPRTFVALDVSGDFGCAVEDNGALWCWGRDPGLELGLRSESGEWARATMIQGIEPVVDVAVNPEWVCATTHKAKVVCWAVNHSNPFLYEPAEIRWLEGVVELELGPQFCARLASARVYCASYANPGSLAQIDPPHGHVEPALSMDVGVERSCSLSESHRVECWRGKGAAHEIDSSWLGDVVPVALEVGHRSVCALSEHGDVLCGPLPDSVYPDRWPGQALEVPPLEPIVQMEIATDHGCGVTRAGSIQCWGGNGWGQLGSGDSRAHTQAITVAGVAGATQVAVDDALSCATTAEGVSCWGTRVPAPFDPMPSELRTVIPEGAQSMIVDGYSNCVRIAGVDQCWGIRDPRALGHDLLGLEASTRPHAVEFGLGELVEAWASCYRDDTGKASCGEFELDGVRLAGLGGSFVAGSWPAASDLVLDIASDLSWASRYRKRHASVCAVIGDPDPRIECIGRYGSPLVIRDLNRPTRISLEEGGKMCAIHDGGQASCSNWSGCRGTHGCDWRRVFEAKGTLTDLDRDCALNSAGDLYCPQSMDPRPARLPLDDVAEFGIQLTADSSRRLCARTGAGRVGCMLRGDDTSVEWLEVDDAVQLGVGVEHLCVRRSSGAVLCEGSGHFGQLGSVPPGYMPAPVRIVFEDIAAWD